VSPGAVVCAVVDPHSSMLYGHIKERLQSQSLSQGQSQGFVPHPRTALNEAATTTMEGIGISRITANFHAVAPLLDDAVRVSDREAVEMAYYLLRNEGVYVGPSAAMNVVGAVKLALRMGRGARVVTILCDGGERYVSKLYNPAWLKDQGLTPRSKGANIDFVSIDDA
jgi:cysteine synthase